MQTRPCLHLWGSNSVLKRELDSLSSIPILLDVLDPTLPYKANSHSSSSILFNARELTKHVHHFGNALIRTQIDSSTL